MLKKMLIFVLLIAALAVSAQSLQNIEADTLYDVTLPDGAASFTIIQRDAAGRVVEDGILTSPETASFRFRTQPSAVALELKNTLAGRQTAFELAPVDDASIIYTMSSNMTGVAEASRTKIEVDEATKANVISADARGYFISDFIRLSPDCEYTLLKSAVRTNFSILYYDADKNYLSLTGARGVIKGDPAYTYIRFFFGGGARLSAFDLKCTKGEHAKAAPKKFDMSPEKGYIVSGGKPAASIILNGAKSDLRERFAAYELRRWVKTVADVELPLYESDENVAGTKIYIGRPFADKVKTIGDTEGYAFVTRNGNSYIFGSNSKGTLFGTWHFIEENLDLIWSRPLDYGAVYEKMKNVPVITKDRVDVPSFRMRSWSMPGGVQDNEITNLCYARNGANPSLTVINFGTSHYLGKLYGRSLRVGGGFMYGYLGKYAKTNPEFFPLTGGSRKITNHAQPCFTNKLSVETIVREAGIHMDTAPDETVYLDCGNEDTWTCCECETCLAPIKLPNGKTLAPKSKFSDADPLFRSTQLYMFLNAVAEGVEKKYPETKITTLAYIFSAEYPAVPIHKNVLSLFAPYPTHNMRFPLRDSKTRGTANSRTWAERFSDWCKGESPLAFYEYLGNAYFNSMPEAAAENLRDLKHKAKNPWGINSEALQDFDKNLYGIGNFKQMWDVNAINMWIITRLMWNPDSDVKKLRAEFIRKTYREAAPQMTEFWNTIVKRWNDPAVAFAENCHSGRGGVFKRYIVDTGEEKRLRKILAEAEKAAKNPNSKKLVQDIIKSFDEWANSLGRVIVPNVEEAASEAEKFNSPHWEKAVKLNDFILPRQYTVKAEERKRASFATEAAFMRDKEKLYVKFTCESAGVKMSPLNKGEDKDFPKGEHVELQFRVKGVLYLFAVGPAGRCYTSRQWDRAWSPKSCSVYIDETKQGAKSWSCILAIPFADLNFKPSEALKYPLETVISSFAGRKESRYKGVVPHNEHILTPLTIEED